MDYAATLKRIGELTKAVASAGRRLGYELRGTTEEAVSRRVMIRDAKFAADSEPYRRSRDLRKSTIKDLMGEESAAAQARASVARSLVERPAQELDELYRTFVSTLRADIWESFPTALEGFRA